MRVIIIGAGVSGLSLQYFLCKHGIEALVIDSKKKLGLPIRDTGLISNTTFRFFPEIKDEVVEEVFDESEFIFDKFSVKFSSKKSKMYMLKRDKLDQEIFNQTKMLVKKPKLLLGKKAVGIDPEKNFVVLDDGKRIKYDILVGADGTYSIVTRTFGLDKNVRYIVAQEAIFRTKTKQEKRIQMFFSDEYSKEHFLWRIHYDKKIKIGYMDRIVNKRFSSLVSSIKGKKIEEYADMIKIGRVKLAENNVMVVGEAAGLLKPFSMGGISYGVVSSFIASKFVKKAVETEDILPLSEYEKIVRVLLDKGIVFGYLSKEVFKLIKRSRFLQLMLKVSNANKLARMLHPDFIKLSV